MSLGDEMSGDGGRAGVDVAKDHHVQALFHFLKDTIIVKQNEQNDNDERISKCHERFGSHAEIVLVFDGPELFGRDSFCA